MPVEGPLYPVNLVLTGRRCLVVGGGRVAARKVEGLVECGAIVDVVAPEVDPAIRSIDGVRVHEREYRTADLDGHRLVIVATGDAALNARVSADAEQAGLWVNSADDPANCTFTLPARLRRGPLLVTVATQGESPAVASWLRQRLEAEIGPEYGTLVSVVAEVRRALQAEGRPTEGLDWQGALESGMLELIREGRLAEAKERLQACLSSSSG